MAQPATNPKIEELKFKLKADPRSRLFFPLAEELRKVGGLAEAEQVLRTGLTTHATYLSAWVSLGRVLKEQHKDREAVEALTKALTLDPGNVVVARLLAESYLNLGEKVEAIKKYKLVHALLPQDEEIEAIIHRLDTEINRPTAAAAPPPLPQIATPAASAPPPPPPPAPPVAQPPVAAPPAPPSAAEPAEENVFDITYSRLKREAEREIATGDMEPMSAAHAESPFEEPAAGAYGSDAFAVEQPQGVHLAAAPMDAELAAPLPSEHLPVEGSNPQPPSADEADIFEPTSEVAPGFIQGRFEANVPPPPPSNDDFAKTITMADLYASQGLIDEARDIYEDILARDPDNASVRQKLEALSTQPAPAPAWEEEEEEAVGEEPPVTAPVAVASAPAFRPAEPAPPPPATPVPNEKVKKLESWLSRVKRAGGDGV
jgi:tetratricopeptide (TPR) repeat protein